MRQIDAELLTKKFLTRYTEREKQGNYTFVACEIKQDFVNVLEDVPTIEPYGTWIPCSERLPAIDDSVGAFGQSDICLCAIKWYDGEITEETGWYNSSGLWNHDNSICEVVAWMPLPEPYTYREEKKDDQC